MAIYHLHGQIISRSKGHSVVAAAAYRAGEKIVNQYDGVIHDYRNKSGIVYREILLAEEAPERYRDRSALWNAAERRETRKNSQLGRELNVALPRELAVKDWTKLVREYVQGTFVRYGMCADIAIHDKRDGNPHAHILLTMRHVGPEGFGAKERGWNDQGNMEVWRQAWAAQVNGALEKMKTGQRLDHRSYQRQGLAKRATVHLGVAAKLEARGIRTERGDINREIEEENRALEQAERELLQKAKAALRRERKSDGSEKAAFAGVGDGFDADFRAQKRKQLPTPEEVGQEMAQLRNRYCQLAYEDIREKHRREQELWKLKNREQELRNKMDEIEESIRDIEICRERLPKLEEEYRKPGFFRKKKRDRLRFDLELCADAEDRAVRKLRGKFGIILEEGPQVLGRMQRELSQIRAELEQLEASPFAQHKEDRSEIARAYILQRMETEASPEREAIRRVEAQTPPFQPDSEEQLPAQYRYELENAVKWLERVLWDEVRQLKPRLSEEARLWWERLEAQQWENRCDLSYDDEWDVLD